MLFFATEQYKIITSKVYNTDWLSFCLFNDISYVYWLYSGEWEVVDEVVKASFQVLFHHSVWTGWINPWWTSEEWVDKQNFNLGFPGHIQNVQYVPKRLKQKVYVVDLINHTSEMSLNSSHFI